MLSGQYQLVENLLWAALCRRIARSQGTIDLLGYDDRDSSAEDSNNPTLWRLNNDPRSLAREEMTLIAGTQGNLASDIYFGEENDMVVPVSSVFCYTSPKSSED